MLSAAGQGSKFTRFAMDDGDKETAKRLIEHLNTKANPNVYFSFSVNPSRKTYIIKPKNSEIIEGF